MCGRFTLILEPEAVQKELKLGDFPDDFQSRYNVAPSQPIAVVTDPESRNVELFHWGLIPSWAKDAAIGNRLINARSETLLEKPAFRTAFARRRCLILADGFYEWYRPDKDAAGKSARRIPYYFQLASHKPFAFAGLWETWRSPEGELVKSTTIITCPANELVSQYHDRMPVILDGSRLWDWIKPDAKMPFLQDMLAPFPPDQMVSHPVSPLVNNPANDSPELVEAVS